MLKPWDSSSGARSRETDDIGLVSLQHGNAGAFFRDFFDDHRFVLGNPNVPVLVDRFELEEIPMTLVGNLVRTTANRIFGECLIAHLFGVLLGLDHALRALNVGEVPGEEERRFLGFDHQLMGTVHVHTVNLVPQSANVGGHRLGSHHFFKTEFHVFRRERVTIVEGDMIAQPEGPGAAIGRHFPFLGSATVRREFPCIGGAD